MTATKEEAKKAQQELSDAAVMLDTLIPDKDRRDEVKRYLLRVDAFLERTGARLPTAAAVAADNARKRAKAKKKPAAKKSGKWGDGPPVQGVADMFKLG